ncbi:aminotransferase class I/II-fold pyridoxal phosphate-dependent enzyme [Synechococcus sp. RSCCF101]|uniref:aminotransferase class I/II-fold pyridoxal phosphate-dependent enzyme n=1 Tax=Synechococcus sp. RSCCF101 TaxID=2511069 RepID=UPI0012485E34|nr:aminotransferase class I/II-fold pyridoxal phosphate-dependent enzyme [Synechococcus sp. RSCCF101]QEY33028.1 aminotransferase class I/II-fold pyridoxal phosphate-dependent enzyme [Synechococcus sp. RSCCF101]
MEPPAAAARLGRVLDPVIPRLGHLLAAHPEALSLGQGMVSWGPPAGVRTALTEACLQPGACDRYGPMAGDPEVLEGLRALLRGRHGLDLDGSGVLATAGSNMAFNAIAQVICDPGDEVILPKPYYFNHVMAVQLAGGQPRAIDAGLILDPERLAAAITPRTRAIVTISPGNPSGAVQPAARLEAINRLCAAHGLFHIHDEAYAAFCHGATPHWSPGSLAGSGRHTVTLGSFSKSHGLAGWRLGYLAAPEQLLPALAKVQDTILICPSRPLQRAALAAAQVPQAWVAQQVQTLEPKRRHLRELIGRADTPWQLLCDCDGAFYGLIGLRDPSARLAGEDPDWLMTTLVQSFGVGVVSGASFGIASSSFRVSYGILTMREFTEAMERLMGGLRVLSDHVTRD